MASYLHEYQVVLEFHGDELEIYDRLVALEEKLEQIQWCKSPNLKFVIW
jgi:hypothetical protein